MSDFVIGGRSRPGSPRGFVTGGTPERPAWTTALAKAKRFATREGAAVYLSRMTQGDLASLDDYGVFEVGPDGVPALVWPTVAARRRVRSVRRLHSAP
jgi:hypothetical protein